MIMAYLLMQNHYANSIPVIKMLSAGRYFKHFAGPVVTNGYLDADKKIFSCPQIVEILPKNLVSDVRFYTLVKGHLGLVTRKPV